MRKICAITANRADWSRLESILDALVKRPDVSFQLIVMGSHLLPEKGETLNEIRRKGFTPDRTIHMEVRGGTPVAMAQSAGLAIQKLSVALDALSPDVVLVPVDRFESLSMGTAAALMNIHVAHIQGGEVTGTIDESVRHALTKLSHLHFVATKESRARVIKMGELKETVYMVGCPATDLLLRIPRWSRKTTLQKVNDLIPAGERKLDVEKPYLFMVQHPVTTEYGTAGRQVAATLEALEETGAQSIALWPNIDAGGESISAVIKKRAHASKNLSLFAHLPTELFGNVLRNTDCLIGNSSSGIREACYFGTPVVNVGSRQNKRERGTNVLDALPEKSAIAEAIETQIRHGRYPIEPIYGDGTAGRKIAEIVATVVLPPLQKQITY